MFRRAMRSLGLVSALWAAAHACSPDLVFKAPEVGGVNLSPGTLEMGIGEEVTVSAVAYGTDGTPFEGAPLSWTTSNAGVVSVSVLGRVRALGAGTAQVRASFGGRSGVATVTVRPQVATVTIAPTSATVTVGGTQQLTATTRDASGNVLTGRTVTWTSSNTGVATVSTTGLVTAVAAGSATISATSEGRSGTAAITVPVPVDSETRAPPRDDAVARDLVNRAEDLDGRPEGFSLILQLERYARSDLVSREVRSRARAQAAKFRQQCASLAPLGYVTCP